MKSTTKNTVASILVSFSLIALSTAKAESVIPALSGPFTLVYEVQEVDRRSDAEFAGYLQRTEAALRDSRLIPKPTESDIDAHLEGRRMMRKHYLAGSKTRVTISSQGTDLLISQVSLDGSSEAATYVLKANGGLDLLEAQGSQTVRVQPVPDISHLYLLPYLGTSLPRLQFYKGSLENGEILVRGRAEANGNWTYAKGTANVQTLPTGKFVSKLEHKGDRGIFSKWDLGSPTKIAGVHIPGTLIHQTYSSLTAFQTPEPAHVQLYTLVSAETQSLPAAEFSPEDRLKDGALIACSSNEAAGAFVFDSKRGTLEEQAAAQIGPFAQCIKPEEKSIKTGPALISVAFFTLAGMMVFSRFVINKPSASSKS